MAVEPYTVGAFIVSTASIITAGAATFAAKWIRELRDEVSRNSRVLHGEEDVEEWGGIVAMVHEHRETLRARDAPLPDGGRRNGD